VNDAVEHALQYRRSVPRIAVARCPFSDAVVEHSVETRGLDQPWWDYNWPQRPREPLPAVQRLVKPGPGAPFVVPRLLLLDRVRAVLSGTTVGGWPAWTVTYFTDRQHDVVRVNDWGASRYWLDAAQESWDAMYEDAEQLDFELAPWIDRGALLWVAPGDTDVRLQSTAAGCPYLGLPGRRTFVRVQDGRTWEPVPG
jgi:hypothetical protein